MGVRAWWGRGQGRGGATQKKTRGQPTHNQQVVKGVGPFLLKMSSRNMRSDRARRSGSGEQEEAEEDEASRPPHHTAPRPHFLSRLTPPNPPTTTTTTASRHHERPPGEASRGGDQGHVSFFPSHPPSTQPLSCPTHSPTTPPYPPQCSHAQTGTSSTGRTSASSPRRRTAAWLRVTTKAPTRPKTSSSAWGSAVWGCRR